MMGDLTPSQYLTIREAMKANPGANAAWLALHLNIKRDLIDRAMEIARK